MWLELIGTYCSGGLHQSLLDIGWIQIKTKCAWNLLELIGTYWNLLELIGQVAYTKARLKSVLPTEKKKKKESQVSIIYRIYETGSERNHDFLFTVVSEK